MLSSMILCKVSIDIFSASFEDNLESIPLSILEICFAIIVFPSLSSNFILLIVLNFTSVAILYLLEI